MCIRGKVSKVLLTECSTACTEREKKNVYQYTEDVHHLLERKSFFCFFSSSRSGRFYSRLNRCRAAWLRRGGCEVVWGQLSTRDAWCRCLHKSRRRCSPSAEKSARLPPKVCTTVQTRQSVISFSRTVCALPLLYWTDKIGFPVVSVCTANSWAVVTRYSLTVNGRCARGVCVCLRASGFTS